MIKMRNSKEHEYCECSNCGKKKSESKEFYDLQIGDELFHLCYACNTELFRKVLKAEYEHNAKVKARGKY